MCLLNTHSHRVLLRIKTDNCPSFDVQVLSHMQNLRPNVLELGGLDLKCSDI